MRHICSSHENNDQYPWSISSVHVRISSTHKEDYQHLWVSSVPLSDCSNEHGNEIFFVGTAYPHRPHGYWISSRVLQISPCIMCVQYIGGIPWVHQGDIMSTSPHASYPPDVLNIPNVLMIYFWCTYDIPQCTHGILPMLLDTHYTGWIFLMRTRTVERCSTCQEDH